MTLPNKGGLMGKRRLPYVLLTHPLEHIQIVRAKNAHIWDSNGHRYADFESGIWCAALGHGHPSIRKVLYNQLKQLIHVGKRFTNEPAGIAARALLELLPWQGGKALFLSSGSEAVELSIRIARIVANRPKLLTFSQSYLAAFGEAGTFLGHPDWVKIDLASCIQCMEWACSMKCGTLAAIDFSRIAAFVLEPGCSGGRILFPPHRVVEWLASRIQSGGGLIIVDEVTTGLGRTGRTFGFEHYRIVPDIVAVGKALGNGYPISAVAVSKSVASALETKAFSYVQSHLNDPLGCAVAAEVIRLIRKEKLVSRAAHLGKLFLERLGRISSHSDVAEVRGRGLMIGVEFKYADQNVEGRLTGVWRTMLERGFILGITPRANVLRFLPPLTIPEDEIMAAVDNLEEVLA